MSKASLSSRMAAWAVNIPIAFTALRTNLMRSVLTTIGIMIGVLSVILAVAVGEGTKVSVLDSITRSDRTWRSFFPSRKINGTRRVVIAVALPNATPCHSTPRAGRSRNRAAIAQYDPAGHRRRNASTTAIGITPGYGKVTNVDAEVGRFISDADVRTAAPCDCARFKCRDEIVRQL